MTRSSSRSFPSGPKNKNVGMLLVRSTAGKLVGSIKMLYADYGLEPELTYVALALDEGVALSQRMLEDTLQIVHSFQCDLAEPV